MSIFKAPTGAEPTISQVETVKIGIGLNLPAIAQERLERLLALRVLYSGQQQQFASDANGALSRFHATILESYSKPWTALKEVPDFAASATFKRLSNELEGLERDVKVGQAAAVIFARDEPLSRADLQTLASLASDAAAFVSRNRGLEAFEGKVQVSANVEALKAELEEAEGRVYEVEHSYPPFDYALGEVLKDLRERAKLPSVSIRERETPAQAPRPLPVRMDVFTNWPEQVSTHATGPKLSDRLFLVQPDALAIVLALNLEAVEAHLRKQLEEAYKGATLVLDFAERKKALADAKAAVLLVQRKLAEGYWSGKFSVSKALDYETDPRALLGVK